MDNQRLIFILVNAITIFCAGLAFTQPLRKRSQWLLWMPLCFALCLGSSFFYFTCTGSWMKRPRRLPASKGTWIPITRRTIFMSVRHNLCVNSL